ncbi:hypothetical protein PV350_23530 [Streptomyces sp. PA03-6a]|nr:hypothetical protein [Streptomyces sp. PA03-6a]
MKIRMKVQVSGTRDGAEWPRAGHMVDLPDAEAAELCAAGLAVPAPGDEVETASLNDASSAVEKRAPARGRKRE